MPSLKPMDLRADQLFSEELRNSEERIERVENVIMAMKEEIDSLSQLRPAIERLVAIESEFEDLIGMLQNLLQTTDTAPTPMPVQQPASLPVTEATPIQAPMIKTSPLPVSSVSVPENAVKGLNLRIGEHPGYTRTVFDLNAPASYRVDLDNEENILVIEMRGVFWVGPASSSQVNSPLISSWGAQAMANEDGTRIVIQLRHPVSIVREETLIDPNRVILDIKRQI